MATNFDLDGYFAARQSNPIDQKLDDLAAANREKVYDLSIYRSYAGLREIDRQIEQEAKDNSISGRLGLRSGGFASDTVNLGASLLSGASRTAGWLTSLPDNIVSNVISSGLNENEIDSYNRRQQGIATPADLEVLNSRVAPYAPTRLQKIELSEKFRDSARRTNDAFNLTGTVDLTNRKAFTDDLANSFKTDIDQIKRGWNSDEDVTKGQAISDVASGITGLITNAFKAVGNNKLAVLEHVMENAPQLLIGGIPKIGVSVLTASNVGYALDTYQQGMEDRIKANNGQLPSIEEQNTMMYQAVALVAAEQMSDLVSLGAAKIGMKAVGDIRTGFKESLKGITKATATGALAEAPTEGIQTYLEGEIVGKPATGAEIYTGAVIGAASGGGLVGGMRTVAELGKATPEHAAVRAEAAAVAQTRAETIKAAEKSGDISGLENDPAAAIRVLRARSAVDTATNEDRDNNIVQADKIISDLTNKLSEVNTQLATPESIQDRIKDLTKLLADPTNTPDQVTKIQTAIDLNQEVKDKFKPLSKEAAAGVKAKVKNLTGLLADATAARKALSDQVYSIPNVEALITQADDVASTDKGAVKRIITLAMASPERLSPEQAMQIAENASNGATEPERAFLRKFSAARIAENKMRDGGGVTAEIYNGSKDAKGNIKNKGIQQYNEGFTKASNENNQTAADTELTGLTKFANDHASKLAAAQAALKLGGGTEIHTIAPGVWAVDMSTVPEVTGTGETSGNNRTDINQSIMSNYAKMSATQIVESLRTKAIRQANAEAELAKHGDVSGAKQQLIDLMDSETVLLNAQLAKIKKIGDPQAVLDRASKGGLQIEHKGFVNTIQKESETLNSSLAVMQSMYELKFNPTVKPSEETKQSKPKAEKPEKKDDTETKKKVRIPNTTEEVISIKDGLKITRYKVIKADGRVVFDGTFSTKSNTNGRLITWATFQKELTLNKDSLSLLTDTAIPEKIFILETRETSDGQFAATIAVVYAEDSVFGNAPIRFDVVFIRNTSISISSGVSGTETKEEVIIPPASEKVADVAVTDDSKYDDQTKDKSNIEYYSEEQSKIPGFTRRENNLEVKSKEEKQDAEQLPKREETNAPDAAQEEVKVEESPPVTKPVVESKEAVKTPQDKAPKDYTSLKGIPVNYIEIQGDGREIGETRDAAIELKKIDDRIAQLTSLLACRG